MFHINLSNSLKESLVKHGFEEANKGRFVSLNEGLLVVIELQNHSSKNLVSVNVGIHYNFLPKVGSLDLVDGKKIDHAECEIRIRLTEATDQKDQWWEIDKTSVDKIKNLVLSKGLSFASAYTVEKIIQITPIAFGDEVPELLNSMTKVRALLLLARVHQYKGNIEHAVEFSQKGLKAAGMAVGPKKAFKDIIKKNTFTG